MNIMTSPMARVAALPLLLAALAGCERAPPAPQAQARLAGSAVGGPLALIDQDGRAVRDAAFAGRWRLIYFGWTNCPDICPTDMARNAQALRAFEAADPARAARVQPIFVTLDPKRDTPAALKAFVGNFHPRLIGLGGTPAQVAAAAKAFRVYAQSRPGVSAGSYMIDHSSLTYLMDDKGRPVSFWSSDEPAAAVADGLAALVR